MIRGLLVDTKNRTVQIINIEDDLYTYYDLLKCRCIDMVEREIGGKWYNIVCDDEGLLKPNLVSAYSVYERIVGNIFICNFDYYGDLLSLDDSDIDHINEHIDWYKYNDNLQPYIKLD